jgi:hypothetical protein
MNVIIYRKKNNRRIVTCSVQNVEMNIMKEQFTAILVGINSLKM